MDYAEVIAQSIMAKHGFTHEGFMMIDPAALTNMLATAVREGYAMAYGVASA